MRMHSFSIRFDGQEVFTPSAPGWWVEKYGPGSSANQHTVTHLNCSHIMSYHTVYMKWCGSFPRTGAKVSTAHGHTYSLCNWQTESRARKCQEKRWQRAQLPNLDADWRGGSWAASPDQCSRATVWSFLENLWIHFEVSHGKPAFCSY